MHHRTLHHDYDREKVGQRGNDHNVIPSPDIKQLPMIPFVNAQKYRKKTPTVSSGYFLEERNHKDASIEVTHEANIKI